MTVTYGRSKTGMKKFISTFESELNTVYKAFTGSEYTSFISILRNYWKGPDAEKFIVDFKNAINSQARSVLSMGKRASTVLENDYQDFLKFQKANLNGNGKESVSAYSYSTNLGSPAPLSVPNNIVYDEIGLNTAGISKIISALDTYNKTVKSKYDSLKSKVNSLLNQAVFGDNSRTVLKKFLTGTNVIVTNCTSCTAKFRTILNDKLKSSYVNYDKNVSVTSSFK